MGNFYSIDEVMKNDALREYFSLKKLRTLSK